MRAIQRLFGACAALSLFAAAAAAQSTAPELARKIDQHLAKRQLDAKVKPAPLADDAEFARRLYLDLAGRIPTVHETRAFLADKQPDRRSRLIDRLLASPRYATHFAGVYRTLLIPEAGNNFLVRFQQGGFEDWLKLRFAQNVGYDKWTRELLTAPLDRSGLGSIGLNEGPSTLAFYSAKEFKPESLAAGAARVFLGVRVECAQCHHHPFASWKREQFWAFAAFFSGIEGRRQGDVLVPSGETPDKKELTIPGTETVVKARFLDGTQPQWKQGVPTRTVMADWVTSPANPYFSQAAANRTWAYLFGTGLVEPVDEMVGTSTTSTHPELLALLAREFADHQFDLKFLIRAMTLTDAYQRTSAGTDKVDATMFARMPVRGLTPEQLFDSLVTATSFRDTGDGRESLLDAIAGKPSARSQVLTKFANQTERATMAQTSIIQALTLMNGKLVADATSLERSEMLAALLDAPFLTTADRLETLYLATLSRRPTMKELDRMRRFVEQATRDATDTQAYGHAIADVFWVLLNSSEFSLNR